MWSDKERLSMWNRVGVKYDSVLIAPAPNIRCPFFVHHIHPPLPTTPTTTTNRLWLLLTSTPRHLPVPLIYSYFSSPPYFLLPPATYPLQQLLVPVHRPYSFTLPPTPSSWLLQLPSSFYQFSFFDNYQLQYQWLQPLPAPVPVTTTSTSSSTSDYNLYQLQHRHLLTLRQLSQKTEKEVTVSKDQLSSNIEPIPWVKTSYPVIFPTCTS